jgi:hypothetical protein
MVSIGKYKDRVDKFNRKVRNISLRLISIHANKKATLESHRFKSG